MAVGKAWCYGSGKGLVLWQMAVGKPWCYSFIATVYTVACTMPIPSTTSLNASV